MTIHSDTAPISAEDASNTATITVTNEMQFTARARIKLIIQGSIPVIVKRDICDKGIAIETSTTLYAENPLILQASKVDGTTFRSGWRKLTAEVRLQILGYILPIHSTLSRAAFDTLFGSTVWPILKYFGRGSLDEIYEVLYRGNAFRLQSEKQSRTLHAPALRLPSAHQRTQIRQYVLTLGMRVKDWVPLISQFSSLDDIRHAAVTIYIDHDCRAYLDTERSVQIVGFPVEMHRAALKHGFRLFRKAVFPRRGETEDSKIVFPCSGQIIFRGTLRMGGLLHENPNPVAAKIQFAIEKFMKHHIRFAL